MAYLIDTQILIWSIVSPEKLSNPTRTILQNERIFVSQVSLLEIVIKQKVGKLPELTLSVDELERQLLLDNFQILFLKNVHFSAYNSIPLLANHKDPFDRLILATALSENLPVISADENFRLYVPQIQLIEN